VTVLDGAQEELQGCFLHQQRYASAASQCAYNNYCFHTKYRVEPTKSGSTINREPDFRRFARF